jgi:hypothetical protein
MRISGDWRDGRVFSGAFVTFGILVPASIAVLVDDGLSSIVRVAGATFGVLVLLGFTLFLRRSLGRASAGRHSRARRE